MVKHWDTLSRFRKDRLRRRLSNDLLVCAVGEKQTNIAKQFIRDCRHSQNPALELANALVMGLQHDNWPWSEQK